METEEINLTKVKQNLLKIPKTRLNEVNDFIEFILQKTELGQQKRIKKLGGMWKGLGFESIPEIEKKIRDIRSDVEKSFLNRVEKCNS